MPGSRAGASIAGKAHSQGIAAFHVAHVHGNNFDACIPGTRVPKTIEMTLVNRALDAGTPRSSTVDYPRAGLDMPNSRKRPELPLDFY